MHWTVWYDTNHKHLVEAGSFDEAIAKGREIDPRICLAQRHDSVVENPAEG